MRLANGLDEFYSRNFNDDDFEYFVDKYGQPSISYPHVHIVHKNGFVFVIASQNRDEHVWRVKMDNPDGNIINSAIREAIKKLSW